MTIWGDFHGLTGVTRGGSEVKRLKNRNDFKYGWYLMKQRKREVLEIKKCSKTLIMPKIVLTKFMDNPLAQY